MSSERKWLKKSPDKMRYRRTRSNTKNSHDPTIHNPCKIVKEAKNDVWGQQTKNKKSLEKTVRGGPVSSASWGTDWRVQKSSLCLCYWKKSYSHGILLQNMDRSRSGYAAWMPADKSHTEIAKNKIASAITRRRQCKDWLRELRHTRFTQVFFVKVMFPLCFHVYFYFTSTYFNFYFTVFEKFAGGFIIIVTKHCLFFTSAVCMHPLSKHDSTSYSTRKGKPLEPRGELQRLVGNNDFFFWRIWARLWFPCPIFFQPIFTSLECPGKMNCFTRRTSSENKIVELRNGRRSSTTFHP